MAMLDKQRTEKLSKAATVLQRHTRGWIARQHYKQALVLVVRMQVSQFMLIAQDVLTGLRLQDAQSLSLSVACVLITCL